MDKLRTQAVERLLSGILSLETVDECFGFFSDLCTIKELQDMAQRFDVACRLTEGKNYRRISEETGASSATIVRVNRCLAYGAGGYAPVIERIEGEELGKDERA